MKVHNAKYVALPSWDGQQWLVRVEDYDYVHRGDTTAGRLEQVGPNASLLLAAHFGCDPSHVRVSVEPQLPKEIEHALQVAEGHVADAARHVDAVVAALRQADMSGHDIAALLTERALQAAPQRPLLIPNSEIATYGLDRRPDVIAVEWPDVEVGLTCCRACVEANHRPWESWPDGTSAAVYDARVRCDICGRDVAQAAREPQR
ncbi:MAG: hypothetical protein ACRD2C_00800 [Acidimicrobiales bacterium]